jgi:hypothetical protein
MEDTEMRSINQSCRPFSHPPGGFAQAFEAG